MPLCLLVVVSVFLAVLTVRADSRDGEKSFDTFFVTRSLGHERLMEYLETARPKIVQVGNYGAMFHGYADDPRARKTPMMLPVTGELAVLSFQKKLNDRVRGLGSKVIGHFRLVKVMGDWEKQSGFVNYYQERWPKDLLGPKPHPELAELLQRNADGKPVQTSRYDNAQLALCLSSPHARRMLKAMLKCAVDHGVDGVVTTYNYHFACACPYCQSSFKQWLQKRLTADELRRKLNVADLSAHKFPVIPVHIPGYPDVATAGDLDWLASRWAAEHFKSMYDEIFLEYGRALKRDLIVAQWNHLSHVSLKEERMFLPLKQWGHGEDYFWNSGGAAFVQRNLNLAEGKAGDAWLSCLYTRELGGGKPFVMGKYDGIRLAVSMAEGYATGGMGMGRYMRFEEPAGFDALVRYTKFRQENDRLFENASPHADLALVLPRQSVWNRRPDALDEFRELGQALLERQVLLDVVADENLTPARLPRYRVVLLPKAVSLSDEQLDTLRDFASRGRKVFLRGETASMDELGRPRKDNQIKGALPLGTQSAKDAAKFISDSLRKDGSSFIDAPWTIRAAAYSRLDRTMLHLVNYDREETPDKSLSGPQLERPKPAKDIAVDLLLPQAQEVTEVILHLPDQPKSVQLKFEQPKVSRLRFTVPSVLVYAIVEIKGLK